jgi:hypothetical protein
MTAINDITGDSIQTRTVTKNFKNNFDKIDWSVKETPKEKIENSSNNDLEEIKTRFFEHWGVSEKTEKLWQEKLEFMQNRNSISAPYVRDDVKPYQSMIDGRMIEGKKAHREHLKRNNCIEAGDMPIKNPERPKDNSLKERLIYEVMERHRGKWK